MSSLGAAMYSFGLAVACLYIKVLTLNSLAHMTETAVVPWKVVDLPTTVRELNDAANFGAGAAFVLGICLLIIAAFRSRRPGEERHKPAVSK